MPADRMITSVDPFTGETIESYRQTTPEEVRAALSALQATFKSWRARTFSERGAVLQRVAQRLRESSAEYAGLMAREMGKPVRNGRGEIEKCAWACDFFAENAEGLLRPEETVTEAGKSYVSFEALGVILAIMPWNFPFWQVFRFAAPALMAGNTVLLKHASNVTGCALAIDELLGDSGGPDLLRTVVLPGAAVGPVIEDPQIKGVTFTGSTEGGRSVAARAGGALKKTVMELGGSDPYLVLEDADLEQAVAACVAGRLTNSGQSCIAAKRFIIVGPRRETFERMVCQAMSSARLGNPLDDRTEVGPLARFDLRDHLHDQVVRSINMGARCLLGGHMPQGLGAFYPPTVLTDVRKGMPAYGEELFGPVAAIIAVNTEAEAIEVANDTSFGLGAAVFTPDLERGESIARHCLEAGSCFVNECVKSDPRLPFGGIKQSGYGRELSSYGIKEFTNIKTVYIR